MVLSVPGWSRDVSEDPPVTEQQRSPLQIIRRKQVEIQTGHSRSTIYLRIQQGLWPRPVRLGPRAVGWPADEIAALNAARIAGQSDDQIQQLVSQLLEARTHAAR